MLLALMGRVEFMLGPSTDDIIAATQQQLQYPMGFDDLVRPKGVAAYGEFKGQDTAVTP